METEDELREAFVEEAAQIADDNFAMVLDSTESPIERLLVGALLAYGAVSYERDLHESEETCAIIRAKCGDEARWKLALKFIDSFDGGIFVVQPKTLGYRLDFAVTVTRHEEFEGGRSTPVWFAVECDGHEFHERTKEQAQRDRKRDRMFVSDGWTVIRFTGSELHADPMRCAKELVDIVNGSSIERTGAA